MGSLLCTPTYSELCRWIIFELTFFYVLFLLPYTCYIGNGMLSVISAQCGVTVELTFHIFLPTIVFFHILCREAVLLIENELVSVSFTTHHLLAELKLVSIMRNC
jgi:hypothetical protein